jgi:glycosyltransferase involved in cell wall biosynthesis
MVQSRVIGLALRKDISTIIFLGNIHFLTTWLGAVLARATGKRVFFWCHGWLCPRKGFEGACHRAFYRLAHGLLLYGHRAKQIGMEEGFPANRMHVIYNSLDYPAQAVARGAIDAQACAVMRSTLFRHPERPLLIYIGRLIPGRSFKVLFEAARWLKQDGLEVNLLVVGEGPERASIVAQAAQDGLEICAYGACYDETTLAKLVMAADLMVVTGRIGLAAMHSLAYGTPVVVHDNPNDQHPEWEAIVPGFNGTYFAQNDSKDLARAIREWLRSAPDREQLRERCYEVVERFYNPRTQVDRIEKALSGAPPDDSDWEAFLRERRTLAAVPPAKPA